MSGIDIELTCFYCHQKSVVYSLGGGDPVFIMAQQAKEIERLRSRVETLERMDREASQVESTICMRTHFTGNPPYVGWKGLNLALNEVIDRAEKAAALLKLVVDAEHDAALIEAKATIEEALAQKEPDGA